MSQVENEIKIKYTYKQSDDYKQYFVNGVYGGPTPHGELLCTFFFEHSTLPEKKKQFLKRVRWYRKIRPYPT